MHLHEIDDEPLTGIEIVLKGPIPLLCIRCGRASMADSAPRFSFRIAQGWITACAFCKKGRGKA